jgi:membrane-associated protease RseP (regulator of RpoE activity)
MSEPDKGQRRETRLLLATIGVSVAMLLLLARFRFPEETARGTAEAPAAAPLERLAARATFDELASTMADLERRIASRLEVVRIQPERPTGRFAPAPRLTPDRGVVVLGPGEQVAGGPATEIPLVIGRDSVLDLAVVALAPRPADAVTVRAGPPRAGPRYVAVAEATSQGPVIRPVYVGRMESIQDPRVSTSLLSVAAPQQTLPPGAAIFDLEGHFIGLVTRRGVVVTIVPGEPLRALAQRAHEAPSRPGDLGIDIQALTPALARAAGAESGVMVSYVDPRGPAAEALSSGDVIRAIDGTNVTTTGGFQQLASTRQPGKEVAISGVRQGKTIEVTVRAIEAGLRAAWAASDTDPGVVVRAVPNVGLEVVALQPSSAAARAGLQPGDIIVAVDGRTAPDANGLTRAFRGAASGAALLLTVRRGTGHRVVALERP